MDYDDRVDAIMEAVLEPKLYESDLRRMLWDLIADTHLDGRVEGMHLAIQLGGGIDDQ